MATFKTRLETSPEVVSAYRGKTTVFLEGETDVRLFQNFWFNDQLDKLEFREPDGGLGCVGVLQSVTRNRQQGIQAFGIVDRDKLQADNKWDLVWETDDEKFEKARPYGPHVRVTRYWEIENYLVHPAALEEHLRCTNGRAPKPESEADDDFLKHAQALIPHAAYCAALRAEGKKEWGDSSTSRFNCRTAVENELGQLNEKGTIAPEVWRNYQSNLPKVEAFSNTTATSAQHLAGLLRRVNGKAFMHRIKTENEVNHDITFHLAAAIRTRNAIPAELRDLMDTLAGTRHQQHTDERLEA